MIKKLFATAVLILFLMPLSVRAGVLYDEDYYKGQVIELLPKSEGDLSFISDDYQTVRVEVLNGPVSGQLMDLNYIVPFSQKQPQLLERGDLVVLIYTYFEGKEKYEILEPYRLSALFWLAALFVLISVLVAGKRGVTALLGLVVTLVILIGWMIPQIVAGKNPFFISSISVFLMATFSFYLSHGFKQRTTLSLISTLLTLLLSAFMAVFAVSFAHLFGLGSEEAASLGITLAEGIDLKGLLLGAIVVGTLGVLDDVTTAQVAVVEELKKANKKLSFSDLYSSAMSVGKEHIASLINTLVIAYVGASLPIFLLFTLSSQPIWVILNNEFFAEEIVRTLIGSATLILSVPLSTWMATWYYHKYPHRLPKEVYRHCCHH